MEHTYGIKAGKAAALRLLYACLTPLDNRSLNDPENYQRFVEAMLPRVREKITTDDVLDFVRAALGVPDNQYLMLLLLIDEGNAADGVFPTDKKDIKVCCSKCVVEVSVHDSALCGCTVWL